MARGRQPRPGAFAVDPVDKAPERAVDIAGLDLLGRYRDPRTLLGWSTRRNSRIERGIEIAAGLGQHQLAQQLRPLLRNAECDMPAAGMAHQVDRPRLDLLDEGDHVGDMLGHPVIVTDAIPVLGKEVPEADRDDAMFFRQRPQHRIPGAEVAERAVHADQRRPFADIEIGHVVSVDAKGLHGSVSQRANKEGDIILSWNAPRAQFAPVDTLTKAGNRALAERHAVWRQFSDAIAGLLGGTRSRENPA